MSTIFDNLSIAHTLWAEGHIEAAQGQLDQCKSGATPRYHGEWHRLYGLCLQSAGEARQAEEAFLNGIAVAQSPQQLARLHNTYAAHLEYEGRIEEAIDHYLTAEPLFRRTHDTESTVANAYNLGRVYLQVGRFPDAGHKFASALSLTGRAHSRASQTLIHAGRSILALIRQQPHLALQRARLARRKAVYPVYEIRALQTQITVLTSLGRLTDASTALKHLTELKPVQDDPVEGPTARVLAGILEDDLELLKNVPPGVHPSWQARALLHRARLSADPLEAVRLAQAAQSLHQRHEEAIFDVMCPAVHRQLIAWGVPLTRAEPEGPTVLTVSIRGVLRLAVNTEVIQARVPAPSAAVLAALITDGPLTTASLLRDVLGTEQTASLDKAVERIRVLIGDETAITSQGEGGARQWSLSPAYRWQLDDPRTGSLLGGLDSPYAQRCELA
ncbi:tetratricopeptide repeat protein [Deinococcus aquaticus]|uniref:tetratricopeptide repeat protein n=1 Tax=Deinococcus aquaticus TaxID=328692 RepID=UPI003F45CE36